MSGGTDAKAIDCDVHASPTEVTYAIRQATAFEAAKMPAIERAAAAVFAEYSHVTGLTSALLEHTNSVEAFVEAQSNELLWVAVDAHNRPVGFVMLRRLVGSLHVHEIDVVPSHARRGLGARLLHHVFSLARDRGTRAVTLTTYRDIPWNAPFYERFGFKILAAAELSDELRAICDLERAMGWRIEARVAMRLELS